MNKREVYLTAVSLRWQAHLVRDWMLCWFNVSEYNDTMENFPFQVKYLDDSTEVLYPKEDAPFTYGHDLMKAAEFNKDDYEWIKVEDAVPMEPLTDFKEHLFVEAGALINLNKDIHTSYGDVLYNVSVVIPAFYDKVSFQYNEPSDEKSSTDPINIGGLEKHIAGRIIDDPEELRVSVGHIKQFPRKPEGVKAPIYVREYVIFSTAMDTYGSFCQYFVKSISRKSLTTDPAYKELRAKLVEKYKDKLEDGATQVLIQNELIALDKKWLEDDDVKFFILKDKTYNTARKRMLTIHGPEAGFDEGGDGELILSNLTEGWDPDNLAPMINSTRAGSYYRGFETAMGGEVVKFFLRIFQNSYVQEGDCGTKEGLDIVVNKWVVDNFDTFYYIDSKKKPVKITKEFLEANFGKKILVRFPFKCKALHSDFCSVCVGSQNASSPKGIGASATSIGSQFMLISMGAAHAKENKTTKLDIKTLLER